MKKIYQILILFFVGLVGVAHADTEAIKASNNQLRLNYVNSHVDYTEKIDGNIADTEKGHVPGFGLSLSLMKDLFLGNDYIYAEFVRSNGDSNYVGSPAYGYPSIAPGYGSYTTNHRAHMTDINLRYGKGIEINNHFMITPYLEIGHHRWTRAFNNEAAVGACTAYCGIYPLSSEEYNNSHFGIGSLFQYSSSDKLVMTGKIMVGKTYMASISGKGSSYLNAAAYVNNGFDKQRLGNDFMYMAGISADYAFTEHIHGNVGVDYVDFRYGKSGLFDNYNYEPDSHTKYTSVNVGIGYAF